MLYQEEDARNGIHILWGEAIRAEDEVSHHPADDKRHDRGADEEDVPVLEGGGGGKLEDEVVVDPGAPPCADVASIQKHMQADQCEHAARKFIRLKATLIKSEDGEALNSLMKAI